MNRRGGFGRLYIVDSEDIDLYAAALSRSWFIKAKTKTRLLHSLIGFSGDIQPPQPRTGCLIQKGRGGALVRDAQVREKSFYIPNYKTSL